MLKQYDDHRRTQIIAQDPCERIKYYLNDLNKSKNNIENHLNIHQKVCKLEKKL